MLLTPQDADMFFKLHRALMCFVNERLQIVPDIASPDEFSSLPPETRLEVREAFLDEQDLIELFVDANPYAFSEDELNIVLTWRNLVPGKFFIFRYLKKYTIFLSTEEPPIAYGVLALTQPFEELVGPYLPVWSETVLLPFKGTITYDSLMNGYNISFGPGIRRDLNESYKEAKERFGIVTSLPMRNLPGAVKRPKRATRKK
jgi:hypothetical protein